MAVISTGPISLVSIQNEFGGTNPISLSEYYKSVGYTTSNNSVNPSSGAISIGSFHGAVKGFLFNPVISTPVLNYNLSTAAISAGWDGVMPLLATVTNNSTVGSASTSQYSFVIPPLPAGSQALLVNQGYIVGCGGSGANVGTTGASGLPGGPALQIAFAAVIDNNSGVIAGGGGGGASGNYTSAHIFGCGGGGAGYSVGAGGSWPAGFYNVYGASAATLTTGGVGGTYAGSGGALGAPGGATGFSEGNGILGIGGAAGAATSGAAMATWIFTGSRLGVVG